MLIGCGGCTHVWELIYAHVGQLWMRSRKFTNWVGWHFITVDSGPEKKLTKLISEVLKRAPVLHLFGNIHLLPVDFLGTQLPSSALASTFIKEAQKEASTVKTAYLASLDEDLTRYELLIEPSLKAAFKVLSITWGSRFCYCVRTLRQ